MVLVLFSSVAKGSSPKKKTERLIAVYQKQLPCQQIFLSGMAFTPHLTSADHLRSSLPALPNNFTNVKIHAIKKPLVTG